MLINFLFKAESRLAARRQARAEAREIRMRELEKQQKEMEENADRQFEANNGQCKGQNLETIVAISLLPVYFQLMQSSTLECQGIE